MENLEAEIERENALLTKNQQVTTDVVNILTSFDSRLSHLEATLLPIHNSTQLLSRIHLNMDKVLEHLQQIIQYFDAFQKHQPFLSIHLSLKEKDLKQKMNLYLEHLTQLQEAYDYLSKSQMKQAESMISKQKSLIQDSVTNLHKFLAELLVQDDQQSPGIQEPILALVDFLRKGNEQQLQATIQKSRLQVIQKQLTPLLNAQMFTSLVTYQRNQFPILQFPKLFVESLEGEEQLLKSLFKSEMPKSFLLQTLEMIFSGFLNTYQQLLNEHLFPKLKKIQLQTTDTLWLYVALDIFESWIVILAPSMENTQNQWPPWIKLLLEMKNIILPSCFYQMAVHCLRALQSIQEELNHSNSSSLASTGKTLIITLGLPPDATVHEMTSNTFQLLKKLSDWPVLMESLFRASTTKEGYKLNIFGLKINEHESIEKSMAFILKIISFFNKITRNRKPVDSIEGEFELIEGSTEEETTEPVILDPVAVRWKQALEFYQAQYLPSHTNVFYSEILSLLIQWLETKAKGYKKGSEKGMSQGSVLSNVFLMNNFFFLSKVIQQHAVVIGSSTALFRLSAKWMASVVGKQFEQIMELKMKEQMDSYLSSWSTVVTPLHDTMPIPLPLNQNSKNLLKSKFTLFNQLFSASISYQHPLSIPDIELRTNLRQEVKKHVGLVYKRVIEKWTGSEQEEGKKLKSPVQGEMMFTKNREKYVKWEIEEVERLCEGLFDPASIVKK